MSVKSEANLKPESDATINYAETCLCKM